MGDESTSNVMRVEIDARDLPRKLLSAKIVVPIAPDARSEQSQNISLWYPKWVPGSHGPGGAIANLAGLKITDADGQALRWTRTAGEVYRIDVEVPAELECLHVHVRYIANQPTTNSMGHDVFGTSLLGSISPSAILFYEDGIDIDQQKIETSVKLPAGWTAASAMQASPSDGSSSMVAYTATTLRTFVDSPIMCGRFHHSYSLTDSTAQIEIAPHQIHVFGDTEAASTLSPEAVKQFTDMVTQAAYLVGSQPFDEFTFLLALTDHLPANGLEHSRSSFNVLSASAFSDLNSLKGWNRLLIPHEYLHAWCGKYRRPAGMVTRNFHAAKDTELLWVYEGLTQYLGEVVEARCGLMSHDEFRDRVAVELRNATHQHNRQWRPLSDTAAASHVLRDGSASWSRLRGSQDYYMEGMLFWLEVDAILRKQTEGKKSIDDFCEVFFKAGDTRLTAAASPPRGYDRAEIISILTELVDFDWDGLIRRRIESPMESYDPAVAELLGFKLELADGHGSLPAATFHLPGGIDEYDSVGAIFSAGGDVKEIRPGGAVDAARMSPGMKIIGVNGRVWNATELKQAIDASENSPAIDLLVVDGDAINNVELQYHDGSRYLTLVRDESLPGELESILAKRPLEQP